MNVTQEHDTSQDVYSYLDMRLHVSGHGKVACPDSINESMCVWVCIKTCEVSLRLLMTAPVLRGPRGLMTSGNCDPRL